MCVAAKSDQLILDNVDAHVSLTAIDLARENGVVMLTIPPHTSHYLQPLDRTCYGSFKTVFGVAMDGWMRSPPGRAVTIYDVPFLYHLKSIWQNENQFGRNEIQFGRNEIQFGTNEIQFGTNKIQFDTNEILKAISEKTVITLGEAIVMVLL